MVENPEIINKENSDYSYVSVANLAYLGDCVYELYVREHLVKKNIQKASVESLKYVTAHVQSRVLENIIPILTEEETDVFKRGRNCGHTGVPKSSTAAEYRRATGLEALFGWLYLNGKHERIGELFSIAFSEENND